MINWPDAMYFIEEILTTVYLWYDGHSINISACEV